MIGKYIREQLGIELRAGIFLWAGAAFSVVSLLCSFFLLITLAISPGGLFDTLAYATVFLLSIIGLSSVYYSILRSRGANHNVIRFGESDPEFEREGAFFLFAKVTQLRARQYFFVGLSLSAILLSVLSASIFTLNRDVFLQDRVSRILNEDSREFIFENVASVVRLGVPEERIVLQGLNLNYGSSAGAYVGAISFVDVSATEHDFRFSRMIGTRILGSDLSRASFIGADLRRLHLENTTLRNADFSQARITQSRLRNVDLSFSVISQALFDDNEFEQVAVDGVDLSTVELSPDQIGGMCHIYTQPKGLEESLPVCFANRSLFTDETE